jgi:phosphate transport system protein
MAKEHIVRAYDEELALLQSKLLEMGSVTADQLYKAIEALVSKNSELAVNVISGDSKVNKLQAEVDRLAVQLLAQRQPMAFDLRCIISGLKMAAELERIADYAANIGKNVIDLNQVSLEQPVKRIIRMAEVAQKMLKDVMSAYQETDISAAIAIWNRDEEINEIYADILSQLRSYMEVDAENIKTYTRLIFVSRCCERIGDHIKNIAESIYYIEHGKAYAELPMSK